MYLSLVIQKVVAGFITDWLFLPLKPESLRDDCYKITLLSFLIPQYKWAGHVVLVETRVEG
jgi:hypothetical protein